MLQDQTFHLKRMTDIRDVGLLPALAGVPLVGEFRGFQKFLVFVGFHGPAPEEIRKRDVRTWERVNCLSPPEEDAWPKRPDILPGPEPTARRRSRRDCVLQSVFPPASPRR